MTAPSAGAFDYIVVGAGSAGCVVANRLSANGANRVLLLEAGLPDSNMWVHVPLGLHQVMGNAKYDWQYASDPEENCNGRAIPVPRGRLLGGCSSMNGLVYVRGQPSDYDVWRQLGNVGWGWSDVLPFFNKSERFSRAHDDERGAEGELPVEDAANRWEIVDAFLDACVDAGIPKTDDYNSGNFEGGSYFQMTRRKGLRASTAAAFLKPARKRENLTVLTQAQASRVIFTGRKATGVEFWLKGELTTASANVEVILCAGAIGSPQLLETSGIGSAGRLSALGVPVVHDLPGVGENLQDHCFPNHSFRVANTVTLNEFANSLPRQISMALQFAVFRNGPMSTAGPVATIFTRSDPSQDIPNVQIQLLPMTYNTPTKPFSPFPGLTAGTCNLRPTSRGSVHALASDARTAPSIRFNFLSAVEDQRVLIDSVRLVRKIVGQPSLAPFNPQELSPGPSAQSDAEILDSGRQTLSTVFHPCGTCKMGHDALAVVDDRLRVHGVAGLRVADASIMPNLVSGNTNAPTIMIGEKAAAMMLEDAAAHAIAA